MGLTDGTCEAVAEGEHSRRAESVAGSAGALIARRVVDQALCAGERVVVIGYVHVGGILEPHLVPLEMAGFVAY